MTTWQPAFVVHRAVDGRLHIDSVEVIEYDETRLAIRGGCPKLCASPGNDVAVSDEWIPLVKKAKVYTERTAAEARMLELASGSKR